MRFLVELYQAPAGKDPGTAARDAADDKAHVVESIELPADETCFLVVEAATRADVVGLMRRAALRVNRISVAFTDG